MMEKILNILKLQSLRNLFHSKLYFRNPYFMQDCTIPIKIIFLNNLWIMKGSLCNNEEGIPNTGSIYIALIHLTSTYISQKDQDNFC